jgi:hypothetical protein
MMQFPLLPLQHSCALTFASLALSFSLSAADSWPDFRGPNQNGHAGDVGLPLNWSETKNVKWKTEIPLLGLSSPIVMDNQVWMTTATEDGHDFYVICFDAANGEIIANKRLFHSDDPQSMGNGAADNSYATPSAVIEPSRVYVHYGSFGTACLDTSTREVIWKRDDLKCWHYRGASSSPVLFENLLILTFDGADLQYVVALDKASGETVWKTDRSAKWNDEAIDKEMVKEGDWRKAHSTPLIVSIEGNPVMCSVGAKAAYGYDPRSGKELWRVDHPAYSAAPAIAASLGRLTITRLPRGSRRSTLIVPPCRLTKARTMARPSPAPRWRADAAAPSLPSMAARISSDIGAPSSSTTN